MEKVSVIGSGTMGHSIAISLAWNNYPVKVYCVTEEAVEEASKNIKEKLEIMLKNQTIEKSDYTNIQKNIQLKTDLKESLSETTFIIEAITENLKMKKELYQLISQYIDNFTILASNTSGFLPSELSDEFAYPEQFAVTHFWNPAHLIPLVEIVPSGRTSQKTIDRAKNLFQSIGKKPIVLKKEITGFIGNRLQYAMLREAQYLLDNGYADKKDIDASVTHSIGRRYPVTGPLMTADLGGLDIFSTISNYLFKELSKENYSGDQITNLVEEGKLGIKNGAGFYEWDDAFANKINNERERLLMEFLKTDRREEG